MGGTVGPSLEGDLHIYPDGTDQRAKLVANHYVELLFDNEYESILCLSRLCNDQDLVDEITTKIDGVGYPTISSLTDYATETLHTLHPSITLLSDHERIELLAAFLDTQDWETAYLQSAAERESFQQDVGELLIEMESRDALDGDQYTSPVLQEIAAVGRDFQSFLEAREYVDRPSLIPRATSALTTAIANETVPSSITKWRAVLVADFEELATIERRFLAAITTAADASIVALAENQSRILSSWREAGSVESMADGLTVTTHSPPPDSLTAPEAIGHYLVTRENRKEDVEDGQVQVIETPTFREQLTTVADEIERLCRTESYTYDDITVAYQDSSAPIERTIQLLRRNGIPTTTVAVNQLGGDPAVRELYDVTRVCASDVNEEDQTAARNRLLDLEDAREDLFSELSSASSAASGLWQWLDETNLKHRISTDWPALAARDQFQQVRNVLGLAEFLESEPELDGSWTSFSTALERAFRYSSSRLEQIEPDRDEGGVAVGTIYGLKHASCEALFLLNVTDEDYPFTPDLTPLLPLQRIQAEPQFPMVTTQIQEDVEKTFQPAAASSAHDDAFQAYFTQVSRRLLGIGARTATEHLYFGIPQEGMDSLGTYSQPSRFLSELIETFECITPLNDEQASSTSHGGASEYVVEHVDDMLEATRRASVGDESVDLDAYERELASIHGLLNQDEAATVKEALTARIDLRQGRVRRD